MPIDAPDGEEVPTSLGELSTMMGSAISSSVDCRLADGALAIAPGEGQRLVGDMPGDRAPAQNAQDTLAAMATESLNQSLLRLCTWKSKE
eukprot:13020759-Alexandrium_andersonii.AAC.1